jgi:hypothetical protein
MKDKVKENKIPEDTLKEGEPHPSSRSAFVWFHENIVKDPIRYIQIVEAISSTALSGNRLAQICYGTLQRLDKGEPVSDRYLLGLCWFMRDIMDNEKPQEEESSPSQVSPEVEKPPAPKRGGERRARK